MQTITCLDLSKTYKGDGVDTFALREVNVTLRKGEFTALVGPSGSGKSTLLSLVGTLDHPTSGTITYDDQKIDQMSKKELADFRFAHIGFIFQQFHLLPALTAFENVLTPLFSRKVAYNKHERAEAVLNEVGLAGKMNALPSQLSGGEQQRVAIARALIHEPDWLLADEPTGNLDSETGERIFQLIQNLKQQCGILFVTHDPQLAEQADRIIELKDGAVVHDSALQPAEGAG